MDWDEDDFVFCGNSYYRMFKEKPHGRGSGQWLEVKVMLLGSRGGVFDALKSVSQTTNCLHLFEQIFLRRKEKDKSFQLAMIDTLPPSPNPEILRNYNMEEIHVIVLVVRTERPDTSHLVQKAERMFGSEWPHHTLVVFITQTDKLKMSGFRPSESLSNYPESFTALAHQVGGGYLFFDDRRKESYKMGKMLRQQLLRLSAQNHHKTLKVKCPKEPTRTHHEDQ